MVPVGVYMYIQIAKMSANAFVRKVRLSYVLSISNVYSYNENNLTS
jgi:hypothetical protein